MQEKETGSCLEPGELSKPDGSDKGPQSPSSLRAPTSLQTAVSSAAGLDF